MLRSLLALALAGTLLTGCGDASDGGADPTPDPQPTETSQAASPTEDVSSPTAEVSDSPTADVSAEEADVPSGEVWEWAFGQNVWEDPLYTLSQEQNFSPGTTDIYANTMGFSLTPDEQGMVKIVTLFNEGTAMVAYPGQLPGGLDWSMTGGDLLEMLGQESLSAFDGVPFSFTAVTTDGYDLDIYLTALHDEDLYGAAMSSIAVRPSQ